MMMMMIRQVHAPRRPVGAGAEDGGAVHQGRRPALEPLRHAGAKTIQKLKKNKVGSVAL